MNDASALEKRNRELTILNSIARELNGTVNLDQTLRTALAQATELLDLETGWVFLLDEETGEPHLASSQNLPPGMVDNPEIMTGWCHCLNKYARGDLQAAVNIDLVTCSRLKKLDDGRNGLKFHSSIPLYTRDGLRLGILNIASGSWRKLTEDDLRILNTIAGFISIAVERSRLFEELQMRKQREIDVMKRELEIAHDMQMALLPKVPPELHGYELSGLCIPSSHVGGDYYNYLFLDDERKKLAVVIADVSGKEMQAATVAMRFNEMLRYEARGLVKPREILNGIDRSLIGRIPPNMFITAGILVLDTEDGIARIASAANPEIHYYSSADDSVRPLGITGFPLGMFEEAVSEEPFQSGEITLQKGDVVVLASDGVEEARNSKGEFYGTQRLSDIILDVCGRGLSAYDIREAIIENVKAFVEEAPQNDDITIVVLKVVGMPGA